ncbi:unnamed protein product [Anisakis simplex]|uniref:Uncharacterized protein n=1 Tax=Anisakis simplex TaxID=6269 RepID=A0A3P6NQ99_ANISI|nr:unnamed protein product [Anisakis simplex]
MNEERDKLLATLSDRSQISNLDAAQMMSTFTWAGVMLTGMTTGCIFTRYLLSPILSLFVSPFYVAAFAYIAMPLIAIQYSTGPIEGDFKEVDRSRRHDLLTISIVEGMLKGFLFSDRYMPGMAPFSFITPLCIGILAPFASPYIAKFVFLM